MDDGHYKVLRRVTAEATLWTPEPCCAPLDDMKARWESRVIGLNLSGDGLMGHPVHNAEES